MGIEKQKALRVPREREIFGYREANAVRIPRTEKNLGYKEEKIRLYTQAEKCDWV